eukprot:gnl/TRDRNA2_/TRDRNA2_78056_c2_seq1.p1 gnl/TRDRNA2_/TRDRNA2_78056_c2~~gnl/TRDRNA2_/TRDRNA2_78056_c2_seq1.p1  ORF type:complete len:388 (+),score=55.79 gnl/TRDRNA2_/TRDRNA2_78056_c2_seq1:157-1164(+)
MTCGDTGLAAESAQDALDRDLRLAADARAEIPSVLPSRLFRTGPCRAALHLAHLIDMHADTAASMLYWHDVVSRRITTLGSAWQSLSNRSSALHSRLRDQGGADYRRRSFEEIYASERWGKKGSSGSGSLVHLTQAIAPAIVALIARRNVNSVLDIGCGYGEWLPPALCDARLGRADAGTAHTLKYEGWDVAHQPVEALSALAPRKWAHCGVDWKFHVRDAVEESPPPGVGLVVLRHVLQHLGHRDALKLLQNVRGAAPGLILITHFDGATNEDLDEVHEGCSSFGLASKSGRVFTGYNLLRPPFGLPTPLEELRETHTGNVMLLFRGIDLPSAQ